MKVLIKRFNGDNRHVDAEMDMMPSRGDSMLIEPGLEDCDNSESQIRDFLDPSESYSVRFKVVEILWRINNKPIVFVENILKKGMK